MKKFLGGYLFFCLILFFWGCNKADGVPQVNKMGEQEYVVTQKTDIPITEVPTEPTEDKEIMSEEVILKNVYTLIEQKNYPMAMSILLKNQNTLQTKKVLEELQYLMSGEYILNLGYGSFAAINKEGNVVFRLYDDQRFGDQEILTSFQNGKSLHETISGDVSVLGWDGCMVTTQTETGHYANDCLVTWSKQWKKDVSLSEITHLDIAGASFLVRDESGGIYYFDQNGNLAEDITKKIEKMTDIVDMEICREGIVVLCSDGTVEYVGDTEGESVLPSSKSAFLKTINGWTDIVDIDSSIGDFVAGLKADGTVVVSDNWVGEASFHDVKNWTDIIAISVGFQSIMGLKRDGTVVYSGHVTEAQKTASEWNDIVAVSASFQSCLGLKADGTLVIAGEGPKGQTIPDLSEYKELYIPMMESLEE